VKAIEDNPSITAYTKHGAEHVDRHFQSFEISGMNADGPWKRNADIVVNCLWEGKAQIDRALKMNHVDEWITRVKYGFVFDSTPALEDLPSLIITHGPFGDIVNFPSGKHIYITWYPACLVFIGHVEKLPTEWEEACEGNHTDKAEEALAQSVSILSRFVPQLRFLKLKQMMAGTIMGKGKTDISDRESGLHKRHGIGVESEDGYYSIFTGKYTSAPANAMELYSLLS
jgi:hypothetical protein